MTFGEDVNSMVEGPAGLKQASVAGHFKCSYSFLSAFRVQDSAAREGLTRQVHVRV